MNAPMRFAALTLTCIAAAAFGASVTHAHDEGDEGTLQPGDTYIAVLNSGQVVADPPCTSNASGNAFLTYDKKEQELCYAVTFDTEGTVSPYPMGIHFHAPADVGETVSPHLFALDEEEAGSPLTDCLLLDKEQARWLKKGLFYIQIHTNVCTSGELRGQLLRFR